MFQVQKNSRKFPKNMNVAKNVEFARKNHLKTVINQNNQKNNIWKLFINLKETIRFSYKLNCFINTSSLHGFRFLDNRYGRIDRIFWMFIVFTSLAGMITIFLYAINSFENNGITINIDTHFLHWNNTFPAVSFCMLKPFNLKGEQKIKSFMRNYYSDHNMDDLSDSNSFLYRHVLDLLFLTPNDKIEYELKECYRFNKTCGVDLDTLKRLLIPNNCSVIFANIEFNGRKFDDCHEIFKLQHTEMGTCFTANGLYFYDFDMTKLPLRYGRVDMERIFSFDYLPDALYTPEIQIHSPETVPNAHSKLVLRTDNINAKMEYRIQTLETENAIETHKLSIAKRKCRFPDERWSSNATFPYSFASCLTYVRVEIELELCNCTMHTSPIEYKDQYCNYRQIHCVEKYDTVQRALNHHHFNEPCLPSCTEMEINFVGQNTDQKKLKNSEEEKKRRQSQQIEYRTTVTILIQNRPALRLIRNVAHSSLEFVVSIGGIFGLFFGGSIISLFEIVYIWILRKI